MTAPNSPPQTAPAASGGDKPTKVLPTDRVRFEKQLDLLRAYAAVSGPSNRPALMNTVAEVAGLNPSTVSLCNAFFVDTKFLERAPSGGFIPAPEVMAFQRAHQWEAATAAQKLAPLLAQTWFYQRLDPKLSMRPLGRSEAVRDLADEANAGTRYENQLALLLDYLGASGLVQLEGDLVRRALPVVLTPDDVAPPPNAARVIADAVASSAAPAPAATPVAVPGVHFTIDVSVDMQEIGTWSADRITAFFEGVAKVLAAKAGEKPGKDK